MAFKNGNSGDIFVQKSPSSTIEDLAKTLKKIYNSKVKVKTIGIRHGEKMHETLLSKEERQVSEEFNNYFRIPADNRDLNYENFFNNGNVITEKMEDYNSHNTSRLDVEGMKELLMKLRV